jgi:hypothetical protein
MKRYFCLWTVIFVALAAAPSSFAQKERVLPEKLGDATCKPIEQVPSVITRDPSYVEVRKEAGATPPEACEYAFGAKTVQVMLEKYRDPSSAYEVYTAYLRPDMQSTVLGKNSAGDREKLIALVGSFVLTVRQPMEIPTADLDSLVKAVRAHADPTPLPPMRAFLPEQDLVQGTQRYALGPAGLKNSLDSLPSPVPQARGAAENNGKKYTQITDQVGFQSGAEAMLAQYRSNRETAVLLLIDYPTPQLAEQHLRHLDAALPEAAKQDGTSIERKGALLSIVLEPSSPKYAEKLRKELSFETTVTWNEPSASVTDPPWSLVLYRIFIGTGIFMVAAVVLGIAFGGLRVFTKRLLPGKIFDRPERMEVLQLGLSGKTIDPRDFYSK